MPGLRKIEKIEKIEAPNMPIVYYLSISLYIVSVSGMGLGMGTLYFLYFHYFLPGLDPQPATT